MITQIILDNYVNTVTADALAPCVSRLSAAMVLTMQHRGALASHQEGFQLYIPVLRMI